MHMMGNQCTYSSSGSTELYRSRKKYKVRKADYSFYPDSVGLPSLFVQPLLSSLGTHNSLTNYSLLANSVV